MELGSKNCSNYSIEQEQYFILSTVSCSVGVLSSLAAIILLLVSKGYKEFIYRLFLYLSTAAVVIGLGIVLVIPLTFSWLMLYQVHTCFNPKIQLISVFTPLFTSVETGVVLVILCRGARSTASVFQEQYS